MRQTCPIHLHGLTYISSIISYFVRHINNFTDIFSTEACAINIGINSRFDLDIYGHNGSYIIPTKGHTDDSLSVVDGEYAYVGDLLGGDYMHFLTNMNDYKESLEKLLKDENIKYFYTSHKKNPYTRQYVEDIVENLN